MRAVLLLALAGVTSCAQMSGMFRRGPQPDPNVEAQYQRALTLLEPGSSTAALDTATMLLDAYLANAGHIERRNEAGVLRRLAAEAVQLRKVSAALQQERAAETRAKTQTADGAAPKPDSDALKEIQRLKDELAAANAELERIRKRLATPKP
jgi:hypothetical protein